MATQIFSRSLLYKPTAVFSLLCRSFSSLPTKPTSPLVYRSFFRCLRPLAAASQYPLSTSTRSFSTRTTTSSLNDPSPNWSNRPPKETILLDGCDFNHWLVVMEKPEGDPTRDEIIDSYIKTLAQVVGSEEEARMKIYSVSTRCYYAFGALVSEELSYKIKELPRVRWVLPDSYLDVKNKDYGGEPFIDGKAVPYDPKYHEEWIRNNARANERNRRNDRPRNFDRSRNYERRRENMQNRDFQNTGPSPMGNQGMQNPASNMGMANQGMQNPASNMAGMPQNNMSGPGGPPPPPPNNYMGGPPPPPQNNYMGGPSPPPQNNYMGGPPPPPQNNYMGGPPPPPQNKYMGGPPPPPNNYMGGSPPPPPPNNYMGRSQDMGGLPPNNMGRVPPDNTGGMQPNAGWSNMPGNVQQNYQNGPDNGAMPHQGPPNYQNNYR
ncbi:multiple organellar RNA editing factor 8, chloroplastic/mitochondrial [Ricinus communis]|uniref:multiple organellar RNA editing factor 8, chloroplastic/mitochondrial n=1 Tax=Ricinus communis TaxID=3988 RepID=UPI00201A3F57|nr:multiple organellar RNA editing factor 8, chloroplastic/mitochondrial [Ricinus communis]